MGILVTVNRINSSRTLSDKLPALQGVHRICDSAPMQVVKRRPVPVSTRERILNEVERLIARKGVHGFRLLDVARPLRIRVPALYKHFASRDDVLIEVSRRFMALLAGQFNPPAGLPPAAAMRRALVAFAAFKLAHPAYVRLALVDLATPDGGMEYVKLAAGGTFEANFRSGPLAAMHARLRGLLQAGARSGDFRKVDPTDFYRVVNGALLLRLVFPSDALLVHAVTPAQSRAVQRWLWDIASGWLAPR